MPFMVLQSSLFVLMMFFIVIALTWSIKEQKADTKYKEEVAHKEMKDFIKISVSIFDAILFNFVVFFMWKFWEWIYA